MFLNNKIPKPLREFTIVSRVMGDSETLIRRIRDDNIVTKRPDFVKYQLSVNSGPGM